MTSEHTTTLLLKRVSGRLSSLMSPELHLTAAVSGIICQMPESLLGDIQIQGNT